MHTLGPLSWCVVAGTLACQIASAKDEWKDHLEEQLKAAVTLTKLGIDHLRVTQPGTVFVIQKEGIGGQQAKDFTLSKVFVRDGEVAQAGGVMAALVDRKNVRVFKPGERVFVSKIDVKDDEVWVFIHSCDTFDATLRGTTQQTRYKSLLTFQFPKGFLPTAEPATVQAAIEAVVKPEAAVKAASTKTVELGQSPEQVEGILGKPEKIINLGPKTVYVYKDMKIVFADRKVADVQ